MPLIQKIFGGVFPDHVFDYEYFDDAVMRFYHQEAIIAALFKIFSALAIVISCLGLYGLVSFMAVRRTKEIGIRKVLGASVQSIVYLFSREFTLLIGLAFLIATPLGYYFMEQWLTGFYYHTFMGWQVFAAAILFSVLIAWMAVGYRAARAALTDPVNALKCE
jgi:ABC-type antimicrobial peptide transport system permease subunit